MLTQLRVIGSSVHDGATRTVGYVVRMAHKAEALLDETTETVRATHGVVETVGVALEQALPMTLPILATIPDTQDDVRRAREAAEHVVALVDTTLVQLDSLPGARLVRRRMTRAAGGGVQTSLMP